MSSDLATLRQTVKDLNTEVAKLHDDKMQLHVAYTSSRNEVHLLRARFAEIRKLLQEDTAKLPVHVVLDEADICAVLRQTFSTPISHEGVSGPRLHALLGRIQEAIGATRYAEFVTGHWPKRLI